MAKKLELTSKKVQISKAEATVVGVIATAVFVTVFSLVSAKALWAQRGYQAKVIGKKEAAVKQLEENVNSVNDLVTSYKQFVSAGTNIIQGNPAGKGDKDGDNARLVLDALPSKYDFPAVASSFEKIFEDRKIDGNVSGTDDEVAQSQATQTGSPTPIEIPLTVTMNGSYNSVKSLISVFEHSIRPFSLQRVTLSGGAQNMAMSIELKTYYQPEKSLKLSIKKEVVK